MVFNFDFPKIEFRVGEGRGKIIMLVKNLIYVNKQSNEHV